MGRTILIIIIILAALYPISNARVINVPADYTTIQAGIDASVTGDTVLVAAGTYSESLLVENKNICLTGGGQPENTTILGFIIFRGATIDTTFVLQGIEIRRAIDNHDLLEIYDTSPTILGCIVLGYWTGDRWGVKMVNSQGIIRSCIIKANRNYAWGYGIKADSGFPIIERNIISGNGALAGGWSTIGWGVELDTGILRYNLIIGNGAVSGMNSIGGGALVSGDIFEITNNTICSNYAYGNTYGAIGGGLSFRVPPNGIWNIVKNNIVMHNMYTFGVNASISDSTWLGWDYNLVFDNDSTDYIGLEPGPHDIQIDPLFVNADSGDYHLLPNSPCIDAGDPSFPLDPDSTRADIGAYYFD